MAGSNELIGRERELEAIERFLSSSGGWPAGLVLAGPAGMGKTSLWRTGVQSARERGVLVLEARAVERELDESYAGLGDLLDPVAHRLALLPSPQRRALETALLLADPGQRPPGHRAMALGLVALLRDLDPSRAVLIAIDDVQWLDEASVSVISYALRRLSRARVGLLVTERQADDVSADRLGLRQLDDWAPDVVPLRPLSLGAVHSLVRNVLGIRLSRPGVRRLYELSEGNPLYVRELARVLADSPTAQDPWQIPLPGDLSTALSHRLAALPRSAREVLAVAALTSAPTQTVLRTVAGRASQNGLRAGLAAGIVQLDGDVVRFTHPLLAAVLLQELDAERKRALHRRLATVVDDEAERARHLGLAATRPNASAADALESAGRREALRGAPAAGAALLQLAAGLVPLRKPRRRQLDLLEAARMLALSGAIDRARDLAAAVLAERPRRDVASQARLLLVDVTPEMDDRVRGAELLIADPTASPDIRSEAARIASESLFIAGDLRRALELARTALRFAEASRAPLAFVRTSCWLASLETCVGGQTAGLLEAAQEQADDSGAYLTYLQNPRAVRGLRHLYRDELDQGRQDLEAVLAEARDRGDVEGMAGMLFHLAELECRAAAFGRAEAAAAEAIQLAEQTGSEQARGAALYAFALAEAHLGDVDATRAAVDEGLRVGDDVGDLVNPIQHRAVRGFLELSLGNHRTAATELRELPRALLAHGIREPSACPVWPDAIEALLGVGELSEADELVETYSSLADEFDCPWAIATAARCSGLLAAARGDLDAAEARLRRALVAHDRVPSRFERSRTQLALGSVLRRAKHRREAREVLAEAEATFRELGAILWAERAAAEAARIGGRRPSGRGMSDTEEQIARLVAAGYTNREVAAALFVTERTVEANLSSIYTKLEIRSRTELARALLAGEPRPAP